MDTTRRSLMAGVSATAALGLAACNSGQTFATVQTYVADADATLDKLVPLVEVFDPAETSELNQIQAQADAAAKAFAALTSPAGAATDAQLVLTAISDGFTVIAAIPGVPAQYVAAIDAAQLLLVVIGEFFNVSPAAVASSQIARAHAPTAQSLWSNAAKVYASASDKKQVAADADAQLRLWLASK
jgi:hypothetical protein